MTTATATIVFTDLVGSTDLMTRVGAAQADELRREHFALLRDALSAHDGREVKNLGDGLMIAFSSALAAVDCAVAIQQRVGVRNRRSDELFGIRVGISSGECDVEADDYFGTPVVEAARLCATCAGGQILLADVTRALLGSRGVHELVSLGPRPLKGLPAPVVVSEVLWTSLTPDASFGHGVPLPPRLRPDPDRLFVGREVPLATLVDAFKRTDTQRTGSVVLVGGEAGIGKTSLLTTFAQAAYERGAIVAYGRCEEDIGMPFQPWSNALGHLVRSLAVDIVAAHVGARGGELVRLVPELQERIPEALAPIATDRESERYVLFAAVADFLQRATAAAPVVIVLDDLHWCAPPTVQLFRHVATMLELAPLMLVGAYRPSDLGADHQMTELIAASHRDTRASRIEMRGLDDDELVELVARAAGHEIDDDGVTLAHALSRETDGNPFFATEILRHLAESGMLRQRDDGQWEADASLLEHGTLPVSVREVVGRRIDRLGPQATRVLRAAAVVGREFDFPILADVTDDDEDDLLNVLDQAVQAAILVNPLADRFSFAHALFAHTLLQSLLPTRRARLHRRVAEALEDRYGDDIGDRIGELAYHWSAAVVPGDVAKAIESARRAAEHALDHLAPDEAIRWYTNALELLGAGSTDEARRCAMLVGLGDAQRQAGRAEHRETLLEAARIADRLNDVSLLAAAALANFRGWNSLLGGEDHERVDTIRRALDAVGSGPSATRARLLAQLSNELIYTADFTYRRDLAEEALSLARELADPALLLQVLNVTHHALWVPDLLDTRLRNTAEACVLAETTDDPVARFWASNYRVFACMEAGHIEEVDRHLADATRIAHELGQPTLRWDITGSLSWRAWLRGDLDESERLATLAFEIGEQSGQPDAFTFFGAQLMMIRWAQGRASELVKVVEDTSSSAPAMGTFRAALVNLYCEVGRNDDARAILEAEAATGFRSMPYDGVWLSGLALYAEAATDVSCRPAAEVLLERLRPWCGQVISTGSTVLGAVTHFVGLLELTLGRLDDAHRSLTDAVEIHERLAAPFPLARSQQALGRVLQARCSAGDARRATAVLELALATAQRHGFAVVERRVRALLDRTA